MEHYCQRCQKEFVLDERANYCPYCGSSFTQGDKMVSPDNSITQAIDAIWGQTAERKRDLLRSVSYAVDSINSANEQLLLAILPNQNISNYTEQYDLFKQSGNRKTLLARIDTYLESLSTLISDLVDTIPADVPEKMNEAYATAKERMAFLYEILQLPFEPEPIDFTLESHFSTKTIYTKAQLQSLYELVLYAHKKYVRCVTNNNMFAAFSSQSNYGSLSSFRSYWRRRNDDDLEIIDIDHQAQFAEVMDQLQTQNSSTYVGLLDEDFVPHVDAFWNGLQKLCEFIDGRVDTTSNTQAFFIDGNARSKLQRAIKSNTFRISSSMQEQVELLHESLG